MGSGTTKNTFSSVPGWSFDRGCGAPLTIVNLSHCKTFAWDRGRVAVEALQPKAHGVLYVAVIPEDVQQGCFLLAPFLFPWPRRAFREGKNWLTKHVRVPAQEDFPNFRFGPLLLPDTTNGLHPLKREHMFLLGNPPCPPPVLGQIREEYISKERERQRDNPVYNEQPAPCIDWRYDSQPFLRTPQVDKIRKKDTHSLRNHKPRSGSCMQPLGENR